MEPGTTDAAPRPYRDRHVGLVCFGVLEILLGLLALFGLLSLALVGAMGSMSAATPGLSGRSLLPSAVMYLLAAVFFIWIGIGSILARRWARALMLIASWFWLVVGLIGLIGFAWIYPAIQATMLKASAAGAPSAPGSANPAGAPEMVAFIQGCMFVALGVFYVLLPVAFVLFYRSPHVKATCEARDPRPRWTDRCPLPVLGLSLFEGLGALACLGVALGYRVLAVFGFILTGLPALVLGLALAVLLALMAPATYRLAPWAWWAAAAFWCLGAASVVATAFHPFDWWQLYRQMGFNTEQLEQTGLGALLQSNRLVWISSVGFLPWLLYLVWVRRFFFTPAGRPAGAPAPS